MEDKIQVRRGKLYMGFSIGTSVQNAEDLFVLKYGYRPTEVVIGQNILLVGPILENQNDSVRND